MTPHTRSALQALEAEMRADRFNRFTRWADTLHTLTEEPMSDSPRMPQWMVERADLFRRVMTPVPLSEVEKMPDPDYGLDLAGSLESAEHSQAAMTPPGQPLSDRERLIASLRQWGLRHYVLCPANAPPQPCECGLNAAIAALRQPAGDCERMIRYLCDHINKLKSAQAAQPTEADILRVWEAWHMQMHKNYTVKPSHYVPRAERDKFTAALHALYHREAPKPAERPGCAKCGRALEGYEPTDSLCAKCRFSDDEQPSEADIRAALHALYAAQPAEAARVEADLAKLRTLPAGWDSYGGAVIDAGTIDLARLFMARINVVPCSDGGVQFEWHTHGIDLEIAFETDGTTTVYAKPNESAHPAVTEADILRVWEAWVHGLPYGSRQVLSNASLAGFHEALHALYHREAPSK